MQISKRTLGILKNFASINQSILIEEGNTIETISNIKDVYAKVEVDETFPVTFAIYDLNEFMGVVSLFDADADFQFGDDSLTIKDGNGEQKYYYADQNIIARPPEKGITLPEVDVEKNITKENLGRLAKAATINNASDITFTEEGIIVHDKTVPTSNKFKITCQELKSKKYNLSISVDKLKMVLDDYDIKICAKGLCLFQGASGIDYYVALQPDGEFSVV